MSFTPRIISLLLALSLLAAACGSDVVASDDPASPADPAASQPAEAQVPGSASSTSASSEEPFDGPIPVESDGGIGDGAGPIPCFEGDDGSGASDLLPCFEEDSAEDDNSWHGAQVAENDCPGMTFTRVEGSVFSFSIPEGFVQQDVQGVDSEIGVWENSSGVKVSYDFGQFSADLGSTPGAWLIPVNYSGIIGEQTIVSAAETDAEISSFSIFFDAVLDASGQPNKLAIVITHTDPNDSLIGHCVVSSVDWK